MNESRIFWLAFFIVSGYLLYILSPILTPFIISALLAYLGDPVCDKLEARGMSRQLSVVTVFASLIFIFVLVVLVLIPTVSSQLQSLANKLPDYAAWFNDSAMPYISDKLGITLNADNIQTVLKDNLGNATSVMQSFLLGFSQPAGAILTWITYMFMIPVITFYLLRDWDVLVAKIGELIPVTKVPMARELATRSDDVLGGFMRGQMLVMVALGVIYSIGLSILGLDLAIVIGMFAGLVSFVPYLGLIVGILIAGIMAILQFHDWAHPAGVVVVFIVAQMIEGMFLTPKFVGDRTGLHPVAVLFAVLAGGQLFGFMGILLALPVAAIINVFLGYFKSHYLQSDIYQDGAIEFGDEPQAEILTPTIELLPHQDKRNGS